MLFNACLTDMHIKTIPSSLSECRSKGTVPKFGSLFEFCRSLVLVWLGLKGVVNEDDPAYSDVVAYYASGHAGRRPALGRQRQNERVHPVARKCIFDHHRFGFDGCLARQRIACESPFACSYSARILYII